MAYYIIDIIITTTSINLHHIYRKHNIWHDHFLDIIGFVCVVARHFFFFIICNMVESYKS